MAAIASLADRPGDVADAVRAEYEAAGMVARDLTNPQADTEHDRLRMVAIAAQRQVLAALRREGRIADDAFHRLEEELDWSELNAAPPGHFQMMDA